MLTWASIGPVKAMPVCLFSMTELYDSSWDKFQAVKIELLKTMGTPGLPHITNR